MHMNVLILKQSRSLFKYNLKAPQKFLCILTICNIVHAPLLNIFVSEPFHLWQVFLRFKPLSPRLFTMSFVTWCFLHPFIIMSFLSSLQPNPTANKCNGIHNTVSSCLLRNGTTKSVYKANFLHPQSLEVV